MIPSVGEKVARRQKKGGKKRVLAWERAAKESNRGTRRRYCKKDSV